MMITDRERLEKIRNELPSSNSYFEKKALVALMEQIDQNTGNLSESLYIVLKEISESFLKNVLEDQLGYEATYEDDYNPYHESYCYKIHIKK